MISMTLPQYRRRECTVDGRCIRLGAQEAEILALLLVSGPDRFIPKVELIEALWPNPDFEPDWAVSVLAGGVCRMRRKGVPIETCWVFGWRIPRWAREAVPERLAA